MNKDEILKVAGEPVAWRWKWSTNNLSTITPEAKDACYWEQLYTEAQLLQAAQAAYTAEHAISGKLEKVADAAASLLNKCDKEGLLLGGGRNSPDEKEGPLTRKLRAALAEVSAIRAGTENTEGKQG